MTLIAACRGKHLALNIQLRPFVWRVHQQDFRIEGIDGFYYCVNYYQYSMKQVILYAVQLLFNCYTDLQLCYDIIR